MSSKDNIPRAPRENAEFLTVDDVLQATLRQLGHFEQA